MSKLSRQLEEEAKAFGILVDNDGSRIVLDAPPGHQFDTELHSLVSAPYDLDRHVAVLHRAIRDVRTYGPVIRKCPQDCTCKEKGDPHFSGERRAVV